MEINFTKSEYENVLDMCVEYNCLTHNDFYTKHYNTINMLIEKLNINAKLNITNIENAYKIKIESNPKHSYIIKEYLKEIFILDIKVIGKKSYQQTKEKIINIIKKYHNKIDNIKN